MAVRVDIGLDLGNDTLKIAYALKTGDDAVEYGKFSVSDSLSVVAVPAIAYYDTDAHKWLYADEVDRSGNTSFVTVVKIKNLISMLHYNGNAEITASNSKFYRTKDQFPKFYFPVRKKVLADFKEMVRLDRTFTAQSYTPQTVCEGFFAYVAKKSFKRLRELAEARGINEEIETRIAVVYPPKVGEEYINELKRICALTFDKPINSALTSTKALGMFAYKRGAIRSNENALVFDMGDEDISVARVGIVKNAGKSSGRFESLIRGGNKDTIVVDGADGHSDPFALGGQNVDERIEAYIERAISRCETMGTPSAGSDGHIAERGLHSKQYLFMKDIKKAKVILSRELSSRSLFKDGVPVTVARSVMIQRKVTRDMLKNCVGTDGTGEGEGIARDIADYIINEIKLPVNRGVSKIFLSGGLTETYSLLEYIKSRISSDPETRGIAVMTFDDDRTLDDMSPVSTADGVHAPMTGDMFTVLSHEDSVYAPAVGGAIVSVLDLKVPTALSLTYGTWGYKEGRKVFIPFVERGAQLDESKPTTFPTSPFKTSGVRVDDEEIYACALSYDDIAQKTVSGIDYYEVSESADPRSPRKAYMLVGEISGDASLVATREKCQRIAGLRTVAGGSGSGIVYLYNDRRVELLDPQKTTKVRFREGIKVTPDGRATPFIENASEPGSTASITYLNGYGKRINADKRETVPAKDISFEFEGVSGFAAAEGK